MTKIACTCFFTGPFTLDDRCGTQEAGISPLQMLPLVQRSSDFATSEDAVDLVSNFHRKTDVFHSDDLRNGTVRLKIPRGQYY